MCLYFKQDTLIFQINYILNDAINEKDLFLDIFFPSSRNKICLKIDDL